jgi:hypothetical protein
MVYNVDKSRKAPLNKGFYPVLVFTAYIFLSSSAYY